jgi:hypothetical protein
MALPRLCPEPGIARPVRRRLGQHEFLSLTCTQRAVMPDEVLLTYVRSRADARQRRVGVGGGAVATEVHRDRNRGSGRLQRECSLQQPFRVFDGGFPQVRRTTPRLRCRCWRLVAGVNSRSVES